MAKSSFSSRAGLIAATVGSAVGLGNIWRFPAEVHEGGGAVFLFLYIICIALLGIPVMMAEFSLGRAGHSDAVGAFRNIAPRSRWWIFGALAVLTSYLILCYYMVVAGWTLEYLYESLTGNLFAGIVPGNIEEGFSAKMETYISSDWTPLLFTWILILLNAAVLIGGVNAGIERISRLLMPLLFILLVTLAIVALSMPGAGEGLQYFFAPDFSKISPGLIVNVLGQAFFSLSLGMGILVTYSAYFPKSTNLGSTSVTISGLDLLVAVMMGVIIFPAVATFGLDSADIRGTTLVFVTLPEVFAMLPGSNVWAILFFTLLLVAALTSTISIAEVSVAFVHDRFHKSRRTAVAIVLLPLFLFSSLCSLSFGSLSDIKIFGLSFFNLLDTVTTNYLLPIVSLGICLFIGWFAPKGLFRRELQGSRSSASLPDRIVMAIVRYIAPLLILTILISGI